MFYRLYRRAKGPDDGIGDLSGWVRSWDGVVVEVSEWRLGQFHGKRVEALVAWTEERNVKLTVSEKYQ